MILQLGPLHICNGCVAWCSCQFPKKQKPWVSDSFAFSSDPFALAELSCPVLVLGFMPSNIYLVILYLMVIPGRSAPL